MYKNAHKVMSENVNGGLQENRQTPAVIAFLSYFNCQTIGYHVK